MYVYCLDLIKEKNISSIHVTLNCWKKSNMGIVNELINKEITIKDSRDCQIPQWELSVAETQGCLQEPSRVLYKAASALLDHSWFSGGQS